MTVSSLLYKILTQHIILTAIWRGRTLKTILISYFIDVSLLHLRRAKITVA